MTFLKDWCECHVSLGYLSLEFQIGLSTQGGSFLFWEDLMYFGLCGFLFHKSPINSFIKYRVRREVWIVSWFALSWCIFLSLLSISIWILFRRKLAILYLTPEVQMVIQLYVWKLSACVGESGGILWPRMASFSWYLITAGKQMLLSHRF